MSRARRENTRPELALRSILHARGLRYRLHYPSPFDRRRKIDVAFVKDRLAVFVDGCFWHSCPEHATFPKANERFWRDKLATNVARDADTNARLKAEGWWVIRVWEHEDPADAAARIQGALVSRRLADDGRGGR